MPSVIALDAMGSDRAPKPEIEGAIHAARNTACACCWSVRKPRSKRNWTVIPAAARLPIEIVHASEVITMEDKACRRCAPSATPPCEWACGWCARDKLPASSPRAIPAPLWRRPKMVLGALHGVDRPALAAVFPTAPGTAAMLLDVGANVDCKPHNLEQFAVMGEIYFRSMFGGAKSGDPKEAVRDWGLRNRPRVGLAFHWRRRNQGQRTDARVVPVAEAPSVELCGQCGRPRPIQRPRRRDRCRWIRGQCGARRFLKGWRTWCARF